jgi:hypothetical protein
LGRSTSPGFVNVAGRDLTLSSSSSLRDSGASSYSSPSGYPFPSPLAAPVFEPPGHAISLTARPRPVVGVIDIGAFEYGTGATPIPPTTPPSTTPVTLRPIEDTFVRNGIYAGTNFGTSAVLDVKTDTEPNLTRDAYLRFDLGSLSTASSAKLRLYGSLSAADTVTATLYPVTGSWSESTLTWNTRPGYSATPLGSFTATSTTAAWRELDVTAHVKGELSAGRRQIALALHAPAASVEKLMVNSREASTNQPELVVTP